MKKSIDATTAPVVQSGFSIFNQAAPSVSGKNVTPKGRQMSKAPTKAKTPKAQITQAAAEIPQSATPEVDTAKLQKQAEKAAATQAKLDAKAAREAAKAEKQAAAALARQERNARIAANKAAREAEPKMGALATKVKAGVYVKSLTGQLRSTDPLATALDAVPPTSVIGLAMAALELTENPYSHLNVGQQSMNLRNKLRGAIKAGKVTIEQIVEYRDKHGLATAEDAARIRAEKKAEREAGKAAKEALKAANAAARVAKKSEKAEAQAAA